MQIIWKLSHSYHYIGTTVAVLLLLDVLTWFKGAGLDCAILSMDDWKRNFCSIISSHSELYNAMAQVPQISVFSTFCQTNTYKSCPFVSSVFSSEPEHTLTVAFGASCSIALERRLWIMTLSLLLRSREYKVISVDISQTTRTDTTPIKSVYIWIFVAFSMLEMNKKCLAVFCKFTYEINFKHSQSLQPEPQS